MIQAWEVSDLLTLPLKTSMLVQVNQCNSTLKGSMLEDWPKLNHPNLLLEAVILILLSQDQESALLQMRTGLLLITQETQHKAIMLVTIEEFLHMLDLEVILVSEILVVFLQDRDLLLEDKLLHQAVGTIWLSQWLSQITLCQLMPSLFLLRRLCQLSKVQEREPNCTVTELRPWLSTIAPCRDVLTKLELNSKELVKRKKKHSDNCSSTRQIMVGLSLWLKIQTTLIWLIKLCKKI